MNQPTPSELDLYINSIVDKLKSKYGYADKNRLKSSVRFYFNQFTIGEFMSKGARLSELENRVIEIPYSELEDAMKNNELPKQIKEIL